MLTLEELRIRAAFLNAIRHYFTSRDFLEVDTPIRQPVIIPESNIEPIPSAGHFLQTSPEICMKRLIAAGSGNIFQLCRCFRKEERGIRHLEEFMMLEWYRGGANYFDLMVDCEGLLAFVTAVLYRQFPKRLATSPLLEQEDYFSLTAPWQRLTVADGFQQWSPISLDRALAEDSFDEILVECIEPNLGVNGPVFLYDYPVSLASLARKKSEDPRVAERFELYIKTIELANGFSELIDPIEQQSRFEDELGKIRKNRGEQGHMPQTFLRDLEKMGDTAGIALGVDRFFMLLLGKNDICDVVTFSPYDLK